LSIPPKVLLRSAYSHGQQDKSKGSVQPNSAAVVTRWFL
jgi:hypothetical protein